MAFGPVCTTKVAAPLLQVTRAIGLSQTNEKHISVSVQQSKYGTLLEFFMIRVIKYAAAYEITVN